MTENQFIKISITGVGIGLPGRERNVFSDDNFDAIFSGKNLIDKIPSNLLKSIADKNIYQVKKNNGARYKDFLTKESQLIKLAAQLGKFDLHEHYGINKSLLEVLDNSFKIAIGAGYEALRDAKIPLIPQHEVSNNGNKIISGWILPKDFQDSTGIIFGSAFPAFTNLIQEVTQYVKTKTQNEIIKKQQTLLNKIKNIIPDPQQRKKIEQIFTEELSEYTRSEYEFNRKFLLKVLLLANSQFAQLIQARGPNTHVNVACTSTTQAIAIAEDWIKMGRCERVIIIGGDDPTNEHTLEWIGSGFLSLGAATTEYEVEKAALPFDKKRDGLILGAGSIAFVVEKQHNAIRRGVEPIVYVLGTRLLNSAYHGTRMKKEHLKKEMEHFIAEIENRYQLDRSTIADSLLYIAHETYTPKKGCATEAELGTLSTTFKEHTNKILISNTKGMTGHMMGVCLEDAMAVKALQLGKIPPVVNLTEIEEKYKDLNFSQGEEKQLQYALRLAAGFGSQASFVLFKANEKKQRINKAKYAQWLQELGGNESELFIDGRVLKIKTKPHK